MKTFPVVVEVLVETNVSTAPANQSKLRIAPEASVNWGTVLDRRTPSARLKHAPPFTVSELPAGSVAASPISSVPPDTVVAPE